MKKRVTIDLDRLKMLCLSVDYNLEGHARDLVEIISVELSKLHKFDTHKFRLELDRAGVEGAIPKPRHKKGALK